MHFFPPGISISDQKKKCEAMNWAVTRESLRDSIVILSSNIYSVLETKYANCQQMQQDLSQAGWQIQNKGENFCMDPPFDKQQEIFIILSIYPSDGGSILKFSRIKYHIHILR